MGQLSIPIQQVIGGAMNIDTGGTCAVSKHACYIPPMLTLGWRFTYIKIRLYMSKSEMKDKEVSFIQPL